MERMYTRFPNLRIASVENGADYLDMLFRKLKQQAKKSPSWFDEDPVELFRQHRENDLVILTKKLGIGVITTAIKKQESTQEATEAAITSMQDMIWGISYG